MHKLIVSYSENSRGGERHSHKPYSTRDPSYTDFNLLGVFLAGNKIAGSLYTEEVEVEFTPKVGQRVYVVLVQYTTGDSFGKSYGNGKIVEVTDSLTRAEKIRDAIYQETYPNSSTWTGYFESLEGVEIHSFVIDNEIDSGGSGVIYH